MIRKPTMTTVGLWACFSFIGGLNWAQPPLLEVEWSGHRERGLPVLWTDNDAILLRPNGSLLVLKTSEVVDHRITTEPYTATPLMQLRAELQREFGAGFEVEATSAYVIVAPHGQARGWGQRFLQLQATFEQYFQTRSMPLRSPDFPLIAIVFHSADEFHRQARREGVSTSPDTLGYYSILTNRMMLYDRPVPASSWFNTDTVILHEATHQLAYNMGIHQRLSDTPVWVAEGLASVFESPGRIETKDRSEAWQRVNDGRLRTWQELAEQPERRKQWIMHIIEGNELFDQRPDEAYAMAWAISFYLAERDAGRYVRYLQHLSKLPPNQAYSKADRRRDFEERVTRDIAILAKNVDRFLADLE